MMTEYSWHNFTDYYFFGGEAIVFVLYQVSGLSNLCFLVIHKGTIPCLFTLAVNATEKQEDGILWEFLVLSTQLELDSCLLKSTEAKKEKEENTWGQNHQGSLQQGDAFERVFKNRCQDRGGRDQQVASSVDMDGEHPKQPPCPL